MEGEKSDRQTHFCFLTFKSQKTKMSLNQN